MKRFFRRLCRLTLVAAFLSAAGLLIYLRQGEDRPAAVRTGKLNYTAQAGWVNWRHAEPDGVRAFLDDLHQRWHLAAGSPFTVTYAQTMGCHWGPIGVEAKLRRTYKVAGGLSANELDLVAFGIFRATSAAFEDMQGRFPNSIDARSQDSSFRSGDLLGNRIAFYRALRGYSGEEVRQWLGESSVAVSLQELARHPLPQNRSWNLPSGLTQSPLNELMHDPLWFAERVKLLEQSETHFRIYRSTR